MKQDNNYSIDPKRLYTPTGVGIELQKSEKWVKENLIYNRACRFKKKGSVYVIYGQWLIEWALSDHDEIDSDDDI